MRNILSNPPENAKFKYFTSMLKKTLITLLVFTLSSCGPVFNTEYVLTPPKSESGRTCTFQCETVKQQCLQIEELQNQRCEDNSRNEQYNCEYNIRITKNREPKWYECGSDSCSVDTERCEQSYRSCFQSCGGKVDAITRCVANCEKLPPPQK